MPTNVYVGDPIVLPLLTRMRLPREVLLNIATIVGGERANVAPTEPSLVVGFETWRWATRFLRENETLKKLGWEACDAEQVHGIRHPEFGIKLGACTTDARTGTAKSPHNVSAKGPASCRLIAQNSGQTSLFPEDEAEEGPKDQLWYYCIHFSEKHIAVEISRRDFEKEGLITHFSDRIIVAKPGDVPGIRRTVVPEDFADLPKPQVKRKNG